MILPPEVGPRLDGCKLVIAGAQNESKVDGEDVLR